MATISTSFTAVGSGAVLLVKNGDQFTYTISGTYAATVSLEESKTGGQSWQAIVTNSTANATVTDIIIAETTQNNAVLYRMTCSSYTSGTCVAAMAEVSTEVIPGSEIKNKSGVAVFSANETGITVGTLAVTGASTIAGAQTFTGAVSVLDTFTIGGTSDPTKKIRFEPDGNTTATTRVITVVDANCTMATTDTTQAITGVKTMTTPVLTNPVINAGTGTLVVPINATPAQTANGSMVWDSDDFLLTVGDGSSRKTMVDVGSTQAITGVKTLTTPVLTNPVVNAGSGTIVLPASTTPAQTAEGSIVWDSDDDVLTVADGSGRKTMVDLSTAQAITGIKTMTTPVLTAATVTAQATDATIGAVAAPASGTTAVTIAKLGNFFVLTFTLTAARIAVTDAGAAGAYGATKIFDFVEGGVSFLGCRQNYTAYTPDGTGVPDDDVFVIGVGTTNISAAADATLAAGEANVGASTAQTLIAGTTTGTKFTAATSAFDGTGTAADLYLNYSGDDVTTDGNGTLDVTGTITVVGVFLGDD